MRLGGPRLKVGFARLVVEDDDDAVSGGGRREGFGACGGMRVVEE